MELDRVKKFLFEKVKRSIIQGNITGIAELPKDEDIEREIDRILNSSKNGILGSITPFSRKEVSNVDVYNNNFLTIKDNIEYLLGEVYDSLNNIIDVMNDSILEKNQVLRDLKMIDKDFSDIEAGTLHNDGLKYVISDSFADTDKVDVSRTTAQMNLNAGNVTLNTTRANFLGFPHYRSQTAINFTFTEGFSKIISQQQTPGSKFGEIFNGDDIGRWELVVTASQPAILEGYFTLKLSEIGSVVEINAITMKLFGTKDVTANSDMLTFHYLNQDANDKTWKILPGGKLEVTGPEVEFKFPNIKTTHIRVTWTKFYPDDQDKLQYLFSVTELNVQKASTVFESVIVSESLQVQPYQTEQPTIFLAELEADKRIQPGTKIDFYLAIDDVIPGKVIDDASGVVDIDSDDAYAFVPNGIDIYGKPENYYVFASQLRSAPHISGASTYQYWQPKWQLISPTNESVKNVPNQLFFNTSDFDKPIHDLFYTNPILWGDPAYTGPWPVAGYAGGWADDWEGNAGAFPQSGYIWGEDPFTNAGVWWGDANEYPGWWRPMTPTASGTLLSTPNLSVPDFSIPVFDISGHPVRRYDPYVGRDMPLQKQFWKIFKWPSTSLPIPGTVKIGNKFLLSDDEARDNVNVWKWNYKSSRTAEDYLISDVSLDQHTNFFTIELEKYLPNRSDIRIIPDSIREVKFKNVTPAEIEDVVVEYGYEYQKDPVSQLYNRVKSSPELEDAHATIIFPDETLSRRRTSTSGNIDLSLLLSYEAKSDVSASWDGYLLVPKSVGETLPRCHVDPDMGSIKKITVQQINDTGLILQTKTITMDGAGDSSDSFQNFTLFIGLNLVRIFVEVQTTQNDAIDSSLATWRPDQNIFNYLPNTRFMGGTYINDPDKIIASGYFANTIVDDTQDFIGSGIVPGTTVIMTKSYITANQIDFVPGPVSVEMMVTKVEANKLTLLSPTQSTDFYVGEWLIKNYTRKTGFTYDKNISARTGTEYLKEVDINVLLHETEIDDDTRFALLEDVDGSQYVVVKAPDVVKFPTNIINTLHFNRTYWDYLQGQYITYTTGTSGNLGINPVAFATVEEPTVRSLVDMPPNTSGTIVYPNVTTYGESVNVTDPTSSGFLFWDTAENLETVFDIKYSLAANNRAADRIFMMAKLISSDLNMSPVLNSYSLIINNKVRSV